MSKIFVAGSLNMDLTIQTDRVPGSGETVTGYGYARQSFIPAWP